MDENYTPEELLALEAAFDEAASRADRALAWEECLNKYCAHVLHYHGGQQRKDLNEYWSLDRYDIAYGHGSHGHIGRDSVVNYFAGMNERWRDVKLKYFSEKYPDRITNDAPFLGVGDYCIHAIFSPHIQVAGDGQTATAYFHSPAICSEADMNGDQGPMVEWGGYGVTFVRDRAGWKIWQLRGYNDYIFFWPGEVVDHTDRPDPPFPPAAERLLRERGESSPEPAPNFTASCRGPMTRYRVAAVEPEMQAPYQTWNGSMSYVRDYPVAEKGGAS